jgi:hypothetical protein
VDDNAPRSQWKLGRVTEIPTSKDGQVRWAMIKTTEGLYKRPAVKVCVLRVRDNQDDKKEVFIPPQC